MKSMKLVVASSFNRLLLSVLLLQSLALFSIVKCDINDDEDDTAVAVHVGGGKNIPNNIVGGTEAGRWPSYAKANGQQLCGASLIAPSILLTAAHCDNAFKVKTPVCMGGNWRNCSDAVEKDNRVARYLKHKDYSNDNNNAMLIHDIMLVLLEQKSSQPVIQWNSISTVPRDDDAVKVIGFGRTKEGGSLSPTLQQVVVPIVEMKVCNESFAALAIEGQWQLCAGSESLDSCQGDSGSPLLTTLNDGSTVVAGLVSYGVGCGRAEYPGVYTRVSSYDLWIRQGICALSPSDCSIPNYTPPPPTPSPTDSPVPAPVAPPSPPAVDDEPPPSTVDDETTTPSRGDRIMSQILAFLWSLISWIFE